MRMRIPEPSVGFPPDFEYCKQVIKEGSKSFHFASLMLPGDVRHAAFATYAFCRLVDDEIDLGANPISALEAISNRLDRLYSGSPDDHPIDRAFAYVVETYALPRALPEGLLEGMRWDTEKRRYQTLAELQDYGARVAGTVGAMMTVIMGTRSPLAVARACDLGIAMQLTNIARDVGEDARAGRLYLPIDLVVSAGIDPEAFLDKPANTSAVRKVVKQLLDAADPIYDRGLSGVSLLPKSCQTAIAAAGKIYREIGAEIRRNNYDSVTQRAVVSKRKKIQLVAEAAFETRESASEARELEASTFLVSAVDRTQPSVAEPVSPTWFNWTLDLFTRLERGERIA